MTIRTTLFIVGGVLLVPSLYLVSAAQQTSVQQEPSPSVAPAETRGRQQYQPLRAARQFVATLSPAERQQAMMEFDDQRRVGWHFIPMDTRKGLPLMEMNEQQKDAALQLLRSAVSKAGFDTSTTIMRLESLLRQLEGPGSEARRNPEKYYVTLFGQPKQGQRWGLSFEGHHLSLNFVFEGNRVTSTTPQFFGANPAVLKENYSAEFKKGMRVLRAEEQLAFQLVKSLDEAQRQRAFLPGETPAEIRAAGEAQPPQEKLPGLAAKEMTESQQELLRKLLQAYTAKMKPGMAKAQWAAIEEAGFDNILFSWSGATKPGVGHYYVLQGPTFLVEFINVQPDAAGNPANHIHCVWRDLRGDFGLPAK
ncbi:MAG: hypothetical protein KatS3mg111_0678 [Pirellulaceae bacterium]|nr:MAG: hypothetical protein KatS3mg111_0678 [Pirellulaceae bacterium]